MLPREPSKITTGERRRSPRHEHPLLQPHVGHPSSFAPPTEPVDSTAPGPLPADCSPSPPSVHNSTPLSTSSSVPLVLVVFMQNLKKIQWAILDLTGFAWIGVEIADSFESLIPHCIRPHTQLASGFFHWPEIRWPGADASFFASRRESGVNEEILKTGFVKFADIAKSGWRRAIGERGCL